MLNTVLKINILNKMQKYYKKYISNSFFNILIMSNYKYKNYAKEL